LFPPVLSARKEPEQKTVQIKLYSLCHKFVALELIANLQIFLKKLPQSFNFIFKMIDYDDIPVKM